MIAVVILEIYDLPIYTAKDNLNGICLLLFMFAFATIPMVHLCEKLFTDASHAAMHILCMNIVIGVTTILIVTLFDVLGESDVRLLLFTFVETKKQLILYFENLDKRTNSKFLESIIFDIPTTCAIRRSSGNVSKSYNSKYNVDSSISMNLYTYYKLIFRLKLWKDFTLTHTNHQ